MIQAIAFDLDGTLVDSVADLAEAVDAMLIEHDRPAVGLVAVSQWIGNGINNLVQRALWNALEGPELDPELYQSALASFKRHYHGTLGLASQPYPGVTETLAQLQQAGLPLAVITNKAARFTGPLLAQLGLDDYFQIVISGDTLAQKKPHPAPLLAVAEHFELEPEQLLMIGDSRHDIQAARAAGCPVAALPYGYNHGEAISLAEPDVVLEDFAGLLAYLDDNYGIKRQDKPLLQ